MDSLKPALFVLSFVLKREVTKVQDSVIQRFVGLTSNQRESVGAATPKLSNRRRINGKQGLWKVLFVRSTHEEISVRQNRISSSSLALHHKLTLQTRMIFLSTNIFVKYNEDSFNHCQDPCYFNFHQRSRFIKAKNLNKERRNRRKACISKTYFPFSSLRASSSSSKAYFEMNLSQPSFIITKNEKPKKNTDETGFLDRAYERAVGIEDLF